MTPLGVNSTTGVAGLTLGGGFGWLSRRLGLSSDNLRAARVVTSDGESLRATANENADLFWGLRGGGGNFSVVTSFEFALHAIGPTVLAGLIVHPLDDAKDVLRFFRSFGPETPDELSALLVMRKAPPLPFLPAQWHGREVLVIAVCYAGDLNDGERILKPLRQFGHPIADVIGPQPFAAWQTILDPLLTPGMRNYWKSHDFLDLDNGLIDVLTDFARRIPDPNSEILVAQLGGAINRFTIGDSAYARRDTQYLMNVHGRWADRSSDEQGIGWRERSSTPPHRIRREACTSTFSRATTKVASARRTGANYDRLVALKNRYDPTNLFRVNQNIRPTAYGLPASETPEARPIA